MNVLNSDRQKSGSPASCRKLESPTNAGGERMSHCVRLKSSETTIGPAVNARNPMIHGETNNKPTTASRFARGDICSVGLLEPLQQIAAGIQRVGGLGSY